MNTRKPYPSDISEDEWSIVQPLLGKDETPKAGRPSKYDPREILNAIRYLARSGCQWDMLPHDFPVSSDVYYHFMTWSRTGLLEKINAALVAAARTKAGRPPQPSKIVVDSQSVKTTEAGGERGCDAGKKINGRKRHILVDTLGLVLLATVHSAAVQDGRGGAELIRQAKDLPQFARTDEVRADGGYDQKAPKAAAKDAGWHLNIIHKPQGQKGFQVIPKRWVVERTFAWLGRDRRLAKDWERRKDHSLGFVYLSSIRILLRKISGRLSI